MFLPGARTISYSRAVVRGSTFHGPRFAIVMPVAINAVRRVWKTRLYPKVYTPPLAPYVSPFLFLFLFFVFCFFFFGAVRSQYLTLVMLEPLQ